MVGIPVDVPVPRMHKGLDHQIALDYLKDGLETTHVLLL